MPRALDERQAKQKRPDEVATPDAPVRIPVDGPDAVDQLERVCLDMISRFPRARQQQLTFLCIGTDRSTGDAFGPLVGTFLCRGGLASDRVLGTLDDPIHAANLHERLREYGLLPPRWWAAPAAPLVIAVDACLGHAEHVGSLRLGLGPLQPGAGVHKRLPAVGDMFVTGIVNVGGFMEYFVLQNTRLSRVMHMADLTASALHRAALTVGLTAR